LQQLARYGSAELKRHYLQPCLEGEQVISIAMIEPEAGSAVTDLQCTAHCQRGTVVIDGEKTIVTNGDIADCFLVWVKFGRTRQQYWCSSRGASFAGSPCRQRARLHIRRTLCAASV
jgi:alkylation response protein AidB-like acyl-CoA dehydrogenase